jgi:basic membrane protein A
VKNKIIPVAFIAAAAVAAVFAAGATSATSVKAGLVSDVGRFNDKGFNQLQLEGLNQAKAKLGVTTRAIESRAAGEYIPNMASLARAGYDIVISAGFQLADATTTVATRFPDTDFAITDYTVFAPPFKGPKSTNVTGLTYSVKEPSYLAGCLSALMAKRGGGNTISATLGVKIPPVDEFLAGYRAGAKKCVAGIRVLFGYSQTFIEQDKCKEIALDQIAKGSKVVFNIAGPCGLGALDAAKEKGVWGIGVDKDQRFLGRHILTSVVKKVDRGVFLTIKAVKDGQELGGKDLVFTLQNSGVGLGVNYSREPAAYKSSINSQKKQLLAAKIKVPAKV